MECSELVGTGFYWSDGGQRWCFGKLLIRSLPCCNQQQRQLLALLVILMLLSEKLRAILFISGARRYLGGTPMDVNGERLFQDQFGRARNDVPLFERPRDRSPKELLLSLPYIMLVFFTQLVANYGGRFSGVAVCDQGLYLEISTVMASNILQYLFKFSLRLRAGGREILCSENIA